MKKLVREVEQVSFSGRRAVAQGQDVTYVTERCVMKLTPEGIVVTEIAPGVDLQAQYSGSIGVSADRRTRSEADGEGACSGPSRWGLSSMADTGDTRIRLEVDGHVAIITIARPEKLNALDYEMVLALERAAHLIEAMREVRVAIITGEGEKSFCAGGDIEAWSRLGARRFRHGLGAPRPPRLRCAGAAASAADRGPQRPHAGRRARARGHRRFPHRRGACETGRARNRPRHHSRLVGHPAQRAPLRLADWCAAWRLLGEVFTAEEGMRLGLVDQVVGHGRIA